MRNKSSIASSTELRLRRLSVEDAMYKLESHIDATFYAGSRKTRIIHGKGAGILRECVWRFLSGHPLVQDYYLADVGEGDAGVTIVELVER